jgi:hypothetical protein
MPSRRPRPDCPLPPCTVNGDSNDVKVLPQVSDLLSVGNSHFVSILKEVFMFYLSREHEGRADAYRLAD